MSKESVEQCSACRGKKFIEGTEECRECKGTGRRFEKVREDCKACSEGRYVRKVSKHKFIVRECNRCAGKGFRWEWRRTHKPCKVCGGTGDFRRRKRCQKCNKKKVKLNSLADFWPEDSNLQLA